MSAILDATPSLIFVRDAAGNFMFENPAASTMRRLTGYLHPTEAQAPTPRQAAELAQHLATDAQVLATGAQMTAETALTLASGEVRHYHVVKRPLARPDGTRQVLVVSTDTTPQWEATLALAQREKQYRDLMMHPQGLICTHDLTGRLLSANPAVAELLHCPCPAARPAAALALRPGARAGGRRVPGGLCPHHYAARHDGHQLQGPPHALPAL
ncbi:MAG: PAS domain-containing protein [Hymenobacter sp.]